VTTELIRAFVNRWVHLRLLTLRRRFHLNTVPRRGIKDMRLGPGEGH
jgi:hypothetical protein